MLHKYSSLVYVTRVPESHVAFHFMLSTISDLNYLYETGKTSYMLEKKTAGLTIKMSHVILSCVDTRKRLTNIWRKSPGV